MIVGDGMLARACEAFENDPFVTIFASGVSNSSEVREEEFQCEFTLLASQPKEIKIVYFSTCSVNDPSVSDTPYLKHKIHMENYIKANFKEYLIFNLPTVVGITENTHTFFNWLVNKIKTGVRYQVFKNAYRYLLDADDVSLIVPFYLKKYIGMSKQIFIAQDNNISVVDIIHMVEDALGKKQEYELVDEGTKFEVDNGEFLEDRIAIYGKINEHYTRDLTNKYIKHQYSAVPIEVSARQNSE